MRILYFSTSYPPYISGTAVFLTNLVQQIIKAGHQVGVAVPTMNGQTSVRKKAGLKEYFLPSLPNPFRQFHTFFWVTPNQVKKIVTEFKPDIIHYNDPVLWPFVIAPWARAKGIKLVITQHGMLDYAAYFFPALKLVLPFFVKKWRQTIELFDLVTVPSQTMSRHLTRDIKIRPDLIKVISNGVDTHAFRPKKISQNQSKNLAAPQLGLKVLFVGRFEREKSLLVLLKAMTKVKSQVELRLVGRGSQMDSLVETVKKLRLAERVEFIQAMPEKDLISQYHWADIFVMPSPIESQSIVTLQAMACGLPVIGANSGALPELILPSKTGWLFKSDNVRDLAKKIDQAAVSSQTRASFGLESRQHALKHNSISIYQTWLKTYQQLLADE